MRNGLVIPLHALYFCFDLYLFPFLLQPHFVAAFRPEVYASPFPPFFFFSDVKTFYCGQLRRVAITPPQKKKQAQSAKEENG